MRDRFELLGNGTTNSVEMTATLRLRIVHGEGHVAIDWRAYAEPPSQPIQGDQP